MARQLNYKACHLSRPVVLREFVCSTEYDSRVARPASAIKTVEIVFRSSGKDHDKVCIEHAVYDKVLGGTIKSRGRAAASTERVVRCDGIDDVPDGSRFRAVRVIVQRHFLRPPDGLRLSCINR